MNNVSNKKIYNEVIETDINLEEIVLECSICFEPLNKKKDVYILDVCNHKYHRECISEWYNKPGSGYKCPECYIQREIIQVIPAEKSPNKVIKNKNIVLKITDNKKQQYCIIL